MDVRSARRAAAPSPPFLRPSTSTKRQSKPAPIKPPACQQCYDARMKCDGMLPCAPCFARCRPCRPREQKLSTLEEIQGRMDLAKASKLFLKAFASVQKEGVINRAKAVALLKEWSLLSILAGGVDVTRGIAQEVCAKMWITPGEILSQRLMELPEPERHARARALFDEQMEEGRGLLKDVPAFRIFDGGRTPAFMLVYREGRGFLRATNAAYEKLTSGLSEEYDQAMTGQALPSLIMTCQIAPEDQYEFVEYIVRIMFTLDCSAPTIIIKAQTRDSTIRLILLKATHFDLPDDGNAIATIITVEALPKTSYVTPRPDSFCRIYAFREAGDAKHNGGDSGDGGSTSRPASAASSSSSVEGGSSSVRGVPGCIPAVACVTGLSTADTRVLEAAARALQTAEGKARSEAIFDGKRERSLEEEKAEEERPPQRGRMMGQGLEVKVPEPGHQGGESDAGGGGGGGYGPMSSARSVAGVGDREGVARDSPADAAQLWAFALQPDASPQATAALPSPPIITREMLGSLEEAGRG